MLGYVEDIPFLMGLKLFNTGIRTPVPRGAGDAISWLLTPAVVSMGLGIFQKRYLCLYSNQNNWLANPTPQIHNWPPNPTQTWLLVKTTDRQQKRPLGVPHSPNPAPHPGALASQANHQPIAGEEVIHGSD